MIQCKSFICTCNIFRPHSSSPLSNKCMQIQMQSRFYPLMTHREQRLCSHGFKWSLMYFHSFGFPWNRNIWICMSSTGVAVVFSPEACGKINQQMCKRWDILQALSPESQMLCDLWVTAAKMCGVLFSISVRKMITSQEHKETEELWVTGEEMACLTGSWWAARIFPDYKKTVAQD